MRVADYIAAKLTEHGLKNIFMVTGGGAMHLNDAIGRNKKLNYICCHHEQACSMAAESHYRLTGKLAAACVTSGPGGTNAITGVYGAWTDSLGMVVISGQVKWETLVRSTGLPLRQLGDQEIDIVKLVEPITKYAVMVTDPKTIRYHLERALYLAKSGRPGPCWLDIPINVQAADIDPKKMKPYNPTEDKINYETSDLPKTCKKVLEVIKSAERPIIMAGNGVRISGEYKNFLRFIKKLGVPVVTAWNAHDLIWDKHPLYAGRPGTVGDRAGNFTVQNADALLVLGCRLNIRQISYNWYSFAKNAYKIIVDIDENELKKPTIKPDLPIHANLADFMKEILKIEYGNVLDKHKKWLNWCQERKKKYPVVLPEYRKKDAPVNPYVFIEELFKQLKGDDTVVTGDGTACVTSFQAGIIKKGQRLYTNSGCAAMGYDLPAALGASIARANKRVICLAGDGSLQMNIQELQTIKGYNLPVIIFVLNNQGYLSIVQTQHNFFPGNEVGCTPNSGVTFPETAKIAKAYDIPYVGIKNHKELKRKITAALGKKSACICEVFLDPNQHFAPKLTSKRLPNGKIVSPSLEDMYPFLSRKELKENTICPGE